MVRVTRHAQERSLERFNTPIKSMDLNKWKRIRKQPDGNYRVWTTAGKKFIIGADKKTVITVF